MRLAQSFRRVHSLCTPGGWIMGHKVSIAADEALRSSQVRPALAQSRRLRLFAVFILYVAQGVPLGLFWFAIPAWMAANGAGATDIAFVLGLTALPWSLKLVNGFIMDRYTFLAMGRRRIWLIGAQLVMIALLIGCALLSPGVKDIVLLGGISFAVNAATTFQDVAVDGLAVDIMEEEERARASGMMFGGQAIGMALSTALSGAAIAAYGPSAAYLLSALFIGVVTILVLGTRERPGERLLPWSSGKATAANLSIQADRWWPILKHTFKSIVRPVSLIYVPLIMLNGMLYGVLTGTTPLIATNYAGWAEDQVTAVSGIGQMVAGIAGMTIGGFLGDKIGAKNASALFFGFWLTLCATMFLAEPFWSNGQFLTIFIVAWLALNTLTIVALLPIAMRLCNRTVAATQFTLYMALSNFGISMGAGLLGLADLLGGIASLFGLLAVANVAAILILIIVRFPTRQIENSTAEHLPHQDGLVPVVD
jgi:MFS transporter, PAT family, beta-lactamase induction signal transducer AmpG